MNSLKGSSRREQLAIEKKRILDAIVANAKQQMEDKKMGLDSMAHEKLSIDQENLYLKRLSLLDSIEPTKWNGSNKTSTNESALRRLKAKLALRKLKRQRHIKLFNIDSYTNELIDNERRSIEYQQRQHLAALKCEKEETESNDDDITIIEFDTLMTDSTTNSNNCELVATERILDRFKRHHWNVSPMTINTPYNCQHYLNLLRKQQIEIPIGLVSTRSEDFKCLISPLTGEITKPYIRRDFESQPLKLKLNQQIVMRNNDYQRHSIDYVHLRPEHVIAINNLCRQHFWTGIDISECLQYPDFTVVALYRKLIIGFAFLVPNIETNTKTHKEAYLSFIFVHPDWRCCKNKINNDNNSQNSISISQYMLFYLIKVVLYFIIFIQFNIILILFCLIEIFRL
jgi:hypothetical protein